ncbi:c-type cytochrome biogenesis protein CcmI [Tabrizicola sp.]|uniref:c-type cytochrome biogenesis protein CcmI n=1 Tax=Tabrizicola sp. TaxID=2005166 RepID=UPI001A596EA5|nr:c-type cytochrome biogenesis protein CcmI [Tabrizicola sp.]MBL9074016.1 c-type cytochrome biogenesis protein CcmI [Tabrizicola sp.]
MTGWGFWAVAASLALLVAAVLVAALRRAPRPGAESAEADLAVYKDQLAEIERDLSRGTLGSEDAKRLRAEIGKRVIEADRARGARGAARDSDGVAALVALILALVVPGGLAAYWWLGAPGYPDMALIPRLEALDAGIAARPSQAAELEQLKTPRDAALDEKLADDLSAITDPAALLAEFRTRFEAGEMQAAVRVQERILALRGDEASANDHANLALALVAEAQGYVSPEAEAELRASLERDMGNELSRYLVGEMFLQGGRYDQAFRFWRPLAEHGMPGSPWVGSIRERIEQVAALAGIRYALPDTLEAPEGMTPEGMVAQLNDRLATEGGTVEEWDRLIRSLTVLERTDEAQKIYDEAKARFEGRPAELSFLKQAAVESGLTP